MKLGVWWRRLEPAQLRGLASRQVQAQAQRLLVELGVPLLLAMPSVGAVLAPVLVPGLAMLAAMLVPGLAMLVPGLAVLVPVVETQDHDAHSLAESINQLSCLSSAGAAAAAAQRVLLATLDGAIVQPSSLLRCSMIRAMNHVAVAL